MAQSSPDWQTVLEIAVPVLGLAGGYAIFVFNTRIKNKEEIISELRDDKDELKVKLEKAENLTKELQATLVKLLNNPEEGLINSNVIEVLSDILRKLQTDQGSPRESEDYKIAAEWLQYRKKELIKSAIGDTMRSHRGLIPRNKRKRFEENIEGCLKWVYVCLNFYEHPDVPLQNYVNTPALTSSIPYIYAIKHIQSFEKIKGFDKKIGLSQDQSRYLKGMFDELITKIPYLFNQIHSLSGQ